MGGGLDRRHEGSAPHTANQYRTIAPARRVEPNAALRHV
jgi:hypothetical protein